MICRRNPRLPLLACALALLACGSVVRAQVLDPVYQMAKNEAAAREQRANFSYLSEERSTRTDNHVWRERVVETDQGALRRLLAIDGKDLAPPQALAEQKRIKAIIDHPETFVRLNETQRDDEQHFLRLLALLPTAFLITPAGTEDGCTRFTFRPSPQFHPSTYEERIVHVLEGTVLIRQPEDRLCALDARIAQPVEFGFGIFGRINSGGHFGLKRGLVAPGYWKTIRISVHVDGRVIMLKNLSREQETVRSEVKLLPFHPTLEQAFHMLYP